MEKEVAVAKFKCGIELISRQAASLILGNPYFGFGEITSHECMQKFIELRSIDRFEAEYSRNHSLKKSAEIVLLELEAMLWNNPRLGNEEYFDLLYFRAMDKITMPNWLYRLCQTPKLPDPIMYY